MKKLSLSKAKIKKASSEFITVLIIIAVFGVVGFTVFNKMGGSWKASGTKSSTQIQSQTDAASNAMKFDSTLSQ